MTSPKDYTQTVDQVIVSNLSFTDLEVGKNSKSKQAIGYPRYTFPSNPNFGNNSLFIQLPWIELTTYGIPKLGEFIKDNSQRLYIKVPLDSIKHANLINFLTEMDNHFGSDNFKTEYLSKYIKTSKNKEKVISKYNYNELLKEPDVTNDDGETKIRPPFIKIKFDTEYSTGNIKTILYDTEVEVNNENSNEYNVISRTKCDNIVTIDDCADKIRWKSFIRPVIRIVKLWCLDPNAANPAYGITLKAAKIDVMKSNIESNSVYKSYMNDDNTFIDNNTEQGAKKESIKSKTSKTTAKGSPIVELVDNEESDSESESESESNEIEINKSPLDGIESDGSDDSDNSDGSEPKIERKKETKKKVVKKEKSNSDSDEEIKPAKSTKSRGKK